MNRITAAVNKAQDVMTDFGARAMLKATNTTGKLMTTKVGKAIRL